jgi:hypothetical protein
MLDKNWKPGRELVSEELIQPLPHWLGDVQGFILTRRHTGISKGGWKDNQLFAWMHRSDARLLGTILGKEISFDLVTGVRTPFTLVLWLPSEKRLPKSHIPSAQSKYRISRIMTLS